MSQNFFIGVLDLEHRAKGVIDNPSIADGSISEALRNAQEDVKAALSDSFNTSSTMAAISTLITSYNNIPNPSFTPAIRNTALWISSMANMLGLNGTGPYPAQEIGWSGISIPEVAKPAVYELSALRDTLRDLAISKDESAATKLQTLINNPPQNEDTLDHTQISSDASTPYTSALKSFKHSITSLSPTSPTLKKDVLTLCDHLRDTTLWNLNIYIEDRPAPLPSLPRLITPQLRQARQEREAKAANEAALKIEREKKKVEEQRANDEKAKVDPREMFKIGERGEEFSAWDDRGLPVRLKGGGEVPKSRLRKLGKEWEGQRKRFDAWKEREAGGGS